MINDDEYKKLEEEIQYIKLKKRKAQILKEYKEDAKSELEWKNIELELKQINKFIKNFNKINHD